MPFREQIAALFERLNQTPAGQMATKFLAGPAEVAAEREAAAAKLQAQTPDQQ